MLAEGFDSLEEFAADIINGSEHFMGYIGVGPANKITTEELCLLSDTLLKMDHGCEFKFERIDNGKFIIYAKTSDLKSEIDESVDDPWLKDMFTLMQ